MQGNHIILGVIIIVVIWAMIEQKLLVTAKYTIHSAKLPKKLNQTSFVILADLHNKTFGKKNERLLKRIYELNPDFILVAGDMINKKAPCYPSSASYLLESLAKKYKVYYAYGNHEQKLETYKELMNQNVKMNQTFNEGTEQKKKGFANKNNYDELKMIYSSWIEYRERLAALKITFLNNDSLNYKINDTQLRISGLSIGQKYFERKKQPDMDVDYLKSLIGIKRENEFQILIAHNPIYFDSYVEWGADLVVSGHLHGGMVRIPGVGGVISPQAKFFPKYHSGVFAKDNHSMVVSRGLGSHSIMPRLFNIPELVYVELKCK